MGANQHLIRVFEIPPPDGRYCFGGGKVMPFIEVDWFKDSHEFANEWRTWPGSMTPDGASRDPDDYSIQTPQGRDFLADHLREKVYFDPNKAYLVMSPRGCFTINYEARPA